MIEVVLFGAPFLVLGGVLGYLAGRYRVRREIQEGISRGVEANETQRRFERQQALLRNNRDTDRRPEHEDEPPSRIGRMDLEPDR